NIDDDAAACLFEPGNGGPAAVVDAEQVGLDGELPFGGVRLGQEGHGFNNRSVVDQHVEAPVRVMGGSDEALHLCKIGDGTLDGAGVAAEPLDFRQRVRGVAEGARADHHGITGPGELYGDGATQPAVGAGDGGDFGCA